MEQQTREIRGYHWFVQQCRQRPWLLAPPLRPLQRLLWEQHRMVGRNDYFAAVARAVGFTPRHDLESYRDELLDNEPLRRHYVAAVESGKIPRKYGRYEDRFKSEANLVHYYALIREWQPKVVVETGTAAGSMTSWVLAALERNGHGKLISIDLPPVAGALTMPITVAKDEVGFLIPREYHGRWDRVVGDAKAYLPIILAGENVDLFIHDSLHTRTHMLFEYNVARCLLKPGKVILSDDILWNKAFFAFTASHNLKSLSCIANPNLGLTVNHFDDCELRIGTGIVACSRRAA